MVELHLLRGDEVVYIRPVGVAPVYIGRAPTNDLVLTDGKVSSRHAVVFARGTDLRVEDLNSKNGTFVNEQKIEGQHPLSDGDRLRLGGLTTLRVAVARHARAPGPTQPLVVERMDAGVRYAVRSDRFTIGSDADADLHIPEAAARAATLVMHETGEIWLGTDDEERELALDEPFVVAGARLVVLEVTDERTRTELRGSTNYPYRLIATLDGPTGPRASLVDLLTHREHVIDTEHRATLLYLLARQAMQDRRDGLEASERGWLSDDDVAGGIWGRERHKLDPNNYHVLICRLRKEIKDAGFDGWFIEKKRKRIRVRLDHVEAQ